MTPSNFVVGLIVQLTLPDFRLVLMHGALCKVGLVPQVDLLEILLTMRLHALRRAADRICVSITPAAHLT